MPQIQLPVFAAGNLEIKRNVACRTEGGPNRLAKLAGTTASVTSRHEDSDYEGHSLTILKRIAAAVEKRVEVHFVPRKDRLQPALNRFRDQKSAWHSDAVFSRPFLQDTNGRNHLHPLRTDRF
jgi:hypothetical protein